MNQPKQITILGAGSWGTTLALLLASKGYEICLWEKFPEYCKVLLEKRENIKFLPGLKIPANVHITSDVEQALKSCEVLVLAIPSHVLRSVLKEIKPFFKNKEVILVSVIKGIENETLYRISQIVKEELNHENFVCLSGPTHAEEVSRKIPSTIVSASLNEESAKKIQQIFAIEYLRVYTNSDLIGVELAGSLKNIIAIAAGISDGLGFGDNTKAALLTRGLAEITRLGVSMGAQAKTFAGLAGMGDLITTCISQHSRNRSVGLRLAKGEKLQHILDNMVMVAEGVKTTKSAMALAKKYQIEMPITAEMYKVLFEDKAPKQAVYDLMTREYKAE